jgi:hypothetical protein
VNPNGTVATYHFDYGTPTNYVLAASARGGLAHPGGLSPRVTGSSFTWTVNKLDAPQSPTIPLTE